MNTVFQVENFRYNGFMVKPLKGLAKYTAIFKSWTNDPGITICVCSDNKERLIPSCCLIGDTSSLPKQDLSKKVIFGAPSNS